MLKSHNKSYSTTKYTVCYRTLLTSIFVFLLVILSICLSNHLKLLIGDLFHQELNAKVQLYVSDISRISESPYKTKFKNNVKDTSNQIQDKVISCYYNFPHTTGDIKDLFPSGINPHLCTHINVAFASIRNKTVYLEDTQKFYLGKVVKLKELNPSLKVLLSIGGANNDDGFPNMVQDHASRKVFIRSVKSLLRNFTLDGIDLDWEFPAIHNARFRLKKHSRERQHFSQLLQEIRKEYIREKRNYLLTVAVAAPEIIVSVSYDVDQLNLYTDFVNIMTYDFHTYSKYTPFTGLNSPLYKRQSEKLYMNTLNINYTVHMYLSKGLDSNKIVVGIPTYGHTFHLVNPENAGIGSPADGYGSISSSGFVDYSQVCQYVNYYNDKVKVVVDSDAKVPYLYRDQDWISFDSQESVAEKAKFINSYNLRGAMIYSLNADDYSGVCEKLGFRNGSFPLLETVKSAINGNVTN